MRRWSRRVVAATVTTVLVILLIPETWMWFSDQTQALLQWVTGEVARPIPQPVVIGVGMILLLIISFAVIFGIVRLFTTFGTKSGERVGVWYERITPDSPQTKGLVFMVAFTVVFIAGIGIATPWFASALTEDAGIGEVVDDIREGRYTGNLQNLFEEDAVQASSPAVSMRASENDTDGDGLPDSWERAGETPGGTALPGASPDSLDLYVQINYGENVSGLTDRELDNLEAVWEEMPVENPDGTTGIDLHVIDQRGSAGQIGDEVLIGSSTTADQFYTRERLESRYCVYHQVVLGQVRSDESIGVSETPGYASIVDGSRFSAYTGEEPFRVALLTHALLHNVVGNVEGSPHTDSGWLAYPDPSNEQLSDAVARKLSVNGFETTQAYQQRCGTALDQTTTQNAS